MLRADAAAVLTVSDGEVHTVFAHRVDPATDWLALLGATAVERASRSAEPTGVALPAGRWDERVAYAALARFGTLATPALLCLLRHAVPFDPVELSSAASAGALLAIGTADSRVVARETAAPGVEVAVARRTDDPTRIGEHARRAADGAPSEGLVRRGDDLAPQARTLLAIVAEGQPATRAGLRAVLASAGLSVVGTAATCAEAIALAREVRADVALVDLGLADVSGTDALARLAAAAPALPIVAFAGGGAVAAGAALAAGAAGFLTKDAPVEQIVAALRAAASGLTVVPRAEPSNERAKARWPGPARGSAGAETPAERAERMRKPLVPHEPTAPRASVMPRTSVTPRELDLLRYLAEGHTNKEIARAMVLAEDTVKKAVQTLVAKLGATDRTSAVVVALRTGLIE